MNPAVRSVVVSVFAATILAGCTPSAQIPAETPALHATGAPSTDPVMLASADKENPAESQRLEELRLGRTHDAFSADLSIGAGDVLRVSVPGVNELKDYEVRVSTDDTITLPVANEIQIAGLNQDGVRQAIRKALERYVKDPDVGIFVKQYQSRQVAIIGMVQKPGLYALTSRTDSILDMVSRAGGMTESAGNSVILVPASGDRGPSNVKLIQSAAFAVPKSARASDKRDGDTSPAEKRDRVEPLEASEVGLMQTPPIPAFAQSHPITISLGDADAPSSLAIPVRPGDVIIVPAAGDVMVQGWVQNPGAFRITPGMTVLGAVTAAGGQLFSSSAEVLRSGGGGKSALRVDLARVEGRKETDLPVRSGDVIIVNRSVAGAVPYFIYEMFTKFGTGMYLPAP